jgi:hypothetical protein
MKRLLLAGVLGGFCLQMAVDIGDSQLVLLLFRPCVNEFIFANLDIAYLTFYLLVVRVSCLDGLQGMTNNCARPGYQFQIDSPVFINCRRANNIVIMYGNSFWLDTANYQKYAANGYEAFD